MKTMIFAIIVGLFAHVNKGFGQPLPSDDLYNTGNNSASKSSKHVKTHSPALPVRVYPEQYSVTEILTLKSNPEQWNKVSKWSVAEDDAIGIETLNYYSKLDNLVDSNGNPLMFTNPSAADYALQNYSIGSKIIDFKKGDVMLAGKNKENGKIEWLERDARDPSEALILIDPNKFPGIGNRGTYHLWPVKSTACANWSEFAKLTLLPEADTYTVDDHTTPVYPKSDTIFKPGQVIEIAGDTIIEHGDVYYKQADQQYNLGGYQYQSDYYNPCYDSYGGYSNYGSGMYASLSIGFGFSSGGYGGYGNSCGSCGWYGPAFSNVGSYTGCCGGCGNGSNSGNTYNNYNYNYNYNNSFNTTTTTTVPPVLQPGTPGQQGNNEGGNPPPVVTTGDSFPGNQGNNGSGTASAGTSTTGTGGSGPGSGGNNKMSSPSNNSTKINHPNVVNSSGTQDGFYGKNVSLGNTNAVKLKPASEAHASSGKTQVQPAVKQVANVAQQSKANEQQIVKPATSTIRENVSQKAPIKNSTLVKGRENSGGHIQQNGQVQQHTSNNVQQYASNMQQPVKQNNAQPLNQNHVSQSNGVQAQQPQSGAVKNSQIKAPVKNQQSNGSSTQVQKPVTKTVAQNKGTRSNVNKQPVVSHQTSGTQHAAGQVRAGGSQQSLAMNQPQQNVQRANTNIRRN